MYLSFSSNREELSKLAAFFTGGFTKPRDVVEFPNGIGGKSASCNVPLLKRVSFSFIIVVKLGRALRVLGGSSSILFLLTQY